MAKPFAFQLRFEESYGGTDVLSSACHPSAYTSCATMAQIGPSPENAERRGATSVVSGKSIEQHSNGAHEIAASDPEERNRERLSTSFFFMVASLPLSPQSILMSFLKHKPCRRIRLAKSVVYDDRPPSSFKYDRTNCHICVLIKAALG